jgi:hypothetical protein
MLHSAKGLAVKNPIAVALVTGTHIAFFFLAFSSSAVDTPRRRRSQHDFL